MQVPGTFKATGRLWVPGTLKATGRLGGAFTTLFHFRVAHVDWPIIVAHNFRRQGSSTAIGNLAVFAHCAALANHVILIS